MDFATAESSQNGDCITQQMCHINPGLPLLYDKKY
jgi:hypothetical protein